MKILLVYPEYPRTYWSFHYALKFVSKKASFPPLGLLTVAAMLPGAWEKKLVDMNVEKLHDSDISWADYVFISAMAIQKESALNVIGRCRSLGIRMVAGGPLFTSEYEEFGDVDHLLLGEGEPTLPEFLRDLEAGCPQHIYRSEEWADLRITPIPLWDLIDTRKYASMNIQYSRGCPFNCDFCNVTALFGHNPRTKDTGQLTDELDALYARGWRDTVFFVDDNFIGNRKKLKEEVLPALITWMDEKKRPFVFNTEASINLADDDELMEMMVRAGFDAVFIGIETTSEESLAECNKMQNRGRDLAACVRKIQKAGLQVQGGFIVGFDTDSAAIFDRLTHFIQNSGIVMAMVGLLNAPKGTKLYQRMKGEGRLMEEFSGDNMGVGDMNFIPKMNRGILIKGYKSLVNTIYSPRCYYERVKTFLKVYRPAETRRVRVRPGDMLAFARSNIRLGLLEKERKYYWRLLCWSVFRRPKLFPMAVTLSIYGFHFRKVYEDHLR